MSKVKEMQLIHVQIEAIQYCRNICVSIELIDAIDVSIKSQNKSALVAWQQVFK